MFTISAFVMNFPSKTPLSYWFYAMFLMINTRAGISAKQLERELGVTYKTAWRMNHQIRKLMAETNLIPLDGEVEIDETYVGGKGKNRARVADFNLKPKEIVMGFVQRGGKVYMKHIESTGKWEIIEQVNRHVDPKARIITDEMASYTQLRKRGFRHEIVNHSRSEYIRGDIHTNTVENVWSHLKRGIFGVYRHVSKKHLQAYADEFSFRFNHRNTPGVMFFSLLQQVSSVYAVGPKQLLAE
jgi:transposase-like protein